MSAFSFEQHNRMKDNLGSMNRNVVQIRTHDSVNNPNRPEFMSDGSAARALFRHAFKELTGPEAGANAYWNNLMSTAARASRDPVEERGMRDRRSNEVEIALAATDDMLSPQQLQGGVFATMARRNLYADMPETLSRRERGQVVEYLTARALAEATGATGDVREPRGPSGREAARLLATDDYKMLAAGVTEIYSATAPDPVDDLKVDIDNLDDAGLAKEAELAESTRVRKTQNVIRSFADSYLRDPVDQANTVASGEKNLGNTVFVMESAQEAAVMESLVTWAAKKAQETGGQKPTRSEIENDLRTSDTSVFRELQRFTMTSVTNTTYHSDAAVDRLQRIADPSRSLPGDNGLSPQDLQAKRADAVKEALQHPGTRELLTKALDQQSKRLNAMTPEQRAENETRAMTDPRVVTARDLSRVGGMLRGTREDDDGKTVPRTLYRSEELVRVSQAFLNTLRYDRSANEQDKKGWAQVETGEYMQRKPIFGPRASQFEFMRATVVDGATFYKNTDAIKDKVGALVAENQAIAQARRDGNPVMENGRPVYPGSILVGDNQTKQGASLPLQAVVEQAREMGVPVVRLTVDYNRQKMIEVGENGQDRTVRSKALTYTVSYSGLDGDGKPETKTAELFSSKPQEHVQAMRALSGAVVVVEGRAATGHGQDRSVNDSQGQMIRWQAMTDIAREAVIFGYGKSDYNANQLIRMMGENGKLSEVLDDNGNNVEHGTAFAAAKIVANNKLETALKALDLETPNRRRNGDMGENYFVDKAAPLDSTYARLLVLNMHGGRTNEDVARMAEVKGTVGDLFKVAEARMDGGKSLDDETRGNYVKIAKAIGADTFSVESVDNIRAIGHASSEARRGMARVQDKGMAIEFDGPGTQSGPLVAVGSKRSYADIAQTPNMMMVGGSGIPTDAQRKAIDDSVAAVAARGYGIVTVGTKGANEAVIDAAVRHGAKVTVVMADNPLVSEPTGSVRQQIGNVVRSENGLVVAKYDMLDAPGRENDRERSAYRLAADMSDAAILVKAASNERAVFEVARFGQDKPVATLPAYSLADTGNSQLMEPFSSAQASRIIGTAISSSFYSTMTPDGRWVTERESEPMVSAHERGQTSVEWHDPAAHMTKRGEVGEFVAKWTDSVAGGHERGMVNPAIKTERDLAVAMGRETAPIDMAQAMGSHRAAESPREQELRDVLRAEMAQVAANTNRTVEAPRRAAGGMEM